jgi:ribonuclease J
MLALQPSLDDFWFLPLGGTGEIGMNLNLYGHDGQWLMVDCGITFEDHIDHRGVLQSRVEMPAIDAIRSHQIQLAGIIVTHAHEDHLGALPHLWDQLGCKIYTTPFTRNVLQNKFARSNCPAPIETVDPGSRFEIGPFSLRLLSMTHSTPETQGVLIETPVAKVFHTADWKLDPEPVVGPAMADETFMALSEVDAIVCDSTNAPQAERAISESAVQAGLLIAIQDAPGRVVVACFASNIARLQTLG